jgi:hypothetical protein
MLRLCGASCTQALPGVRGPEAALAALEAAVSEAGGMCFCRNVYLCYVYAHDCVCVRHVIRTGTP